MERRGPFVPGLRVCFVFLFIVSLTALSFTPVSAQARFPQAQDDSLIPKREHSRMQVAARQQLKAAAPRLPLQFEVNQGQAPSQVKFLSRGPGYNLALTHDQAALLLQKDRSARQAEPGNRVSRGNVPASFDVLRFRFENGNRATLVAGEDELPGKSNYFTGNDSGKWRANIPNFARVRYHDIYPGIDLAFYGNQGRLEYDFVVARGARPQDIALKIDGAKKIEIDGKGGLVLRVGDRLVRFEKPLFYQEVDGIRHEIAGGYQIDKETVRFRVGEYDRKQPLVIDPVLSFSTFFGGSGDELAVLGNIDGGIAVDSVTGNIFVAGETLSPSFAFGAFPAGGFDQGCGTDTPPTCNSTAAGGPFSDIFIAKLNPTASAVLAFTYLGGSDRDILGLNAFSGALVVDATGVYVSGTTFSTDFPTTAGVFQPSCPAANPGCAGAGDGFVTKLDVNLSSLLFSTYLSGTGAGQAGQLQVDSAGNVYVSGQAEAGYPTTSGAFQTSCSTPNCARGFVTALDNAGRTQLFSTFLGGSGNDAIYAMALDSNKNVYVSGLTMSADFPTTAGVVQPNPPNGGIYSTANSGSSWSSLTSGLITAGVTTLDVQAIAIKPGTPATVIAGTNQGIFITTNSGGQWAFAAGTTGLNVVSLAFDPVNPQNAYAATQGTGTGLFKSVDGGNTWAASNGAGATGLPTNDDTAVACDPKTSGTVYVGTARNGVYKSLDGGATFNQANNGITTNNITAVAIDPITTSNVYAGTAGSGVFASTSGGANWSQMSTGIVSTNGSTPRMFALAIDPVTTSTVYAATSDGMFKTTTSGSSWTAMNSGLTAGTTGSLNRGIRAVVIDPTNTQNLYVATRTAGVYHSTNGGSTWAAANSGMSLFLTSLALQNSTTVYAGATMRSGFVAKLNAGGSSLAYSTFFGGNSQTVVSGIGLDSSSNVYVGGTTTATNLPVSASAFQKNMLGLSNAFAAKLNSTGTAVSYATYLGGTNSDSAYSLAVDVSQNAWLTGVTSSDDFPLANGIWLNSPGNQGQNNEAFITEVNPTGSGLLFSTYLGGSNGAAGPADSEGVDIAVDATGNAYVMGFTNTMDFPTASALQPATGGGYDAFIAKIGAATTTTDLSICMVDSTGACTTTPPAPVVAGSNLVFNLLVTNKSTTTPATGVVVGGRGGSGIRAVACIVSAGTCALDNTSGASTIPNGGFASLGTIAPGASVQIVITLRATQAGTFNVTVDVRENENDANLSDNRASTTITVLAGADIAVSLSQSPSPVLSVPANVTYTAVVSNLGPSVASNVTATITFTPATAVTFGAIPAQCSANAGVLTCALGAMNPGPNGAGNIPVTLTSLPVTVTLAATNTPEADPDLSNNTATVVSSANERLLVTDVNSSSVTVFDPSNNGLLETAIAGTNANAVAVSPNRRLAFVGNLNATYISVVDLTIGREIKRIQGVRASRNLALTSDGSLLVVPDLDKDDVVIIDTNSLQVLTRISVANVVGATPGTIGVSSVVTVGTFAFVDNQGASAAGNTGLPLAVVDLKGLRANPVSGTGGGGFGLQSSSLAVTPDLSHVVAIRQSPDTLLLIDPTTDSVVQTTSLTVTPFGIAVTPNGSDPSKIFGYLVHSGAAGPVASVVDLRQGSASLGTLLAGTDVTLPFSVNAGGTAMAVSRDGTRLAIASLAPTSGVNVVVLDTGLMQTNPAGAIVSSFHAGGVPASVRNLVYALTDDNQPPSTAPVVSSSSGAALNGVATPVVVNGMNFAPGAVVRIGKMDPIAATNITATSLSVTVPANAPVQQLADIIVTNPAPASGAVSIDTQNQSGLLAGQFTIVYPQNYHPFNQVLNSNFGDGTVSLLDLQQRANTVPPITGVGPGPMGIAITPDGQYAYVAPFRNPSVVQAINLSTKQVTNIAIAGSNAVGQVDSIAIAPNPASGGAVAYVLYQWRSATTPFTFDLQVAMIDANPTSPTFNTVIRTLVAGFNSNTAITPGGTAVTPDGKFVYGNDASGRMVAFDVVAGTATVLSAATLGVAAFQAQPYVTPDGASLLLADANPSPSPVDVFDISVSHTNPTLVTKINGTAPAGGVAPAFGTFRVVGTQLFAFDSSQQMVQAFNFNRASSNFSQLGSYVIPGNFNEFFADLGVTPDGLLVYAQLHTDDAVAVLDAQALASGSANPLITELATGLGPISLAINPNTVAEPDLTVSMGGPTAAAPGSSIFYTITVGNLRSTTANNVTLVPVFAPTLTITNLTTTQGSCTLTPAQTCSLGNIAQGQIVTVTLVATAPATGNPCAGSLTLGCITAGVVAAPDSTQVDYDLTNNTAVVTTPLQTGGTTGCTGSTTNWLGGPGNWSDTSKWSTGVVPNGSSVNVCIDGGNPAASAVTLDINATVGNLFIDNDDSLTVSNSTTLTVAGNITNSGQILVSTAANNANISISGAVSLTGGGTVTLLSAGAGLPYIDQAVANSTLTNVNNTIQGAGQIGNNGLALVNQGTINANASTLPLLVNSSTLINSGMLESSGGGVLQLDQAVNNAGGTIQASGIGSSTQFLGGTNIQGGTLTTASGGVLGTASGASATLDGSTAGGPVNISAASTYTVANNSSTVLAGTINNIGAILVSAGANTANLSANGPLTLTGAGTVTLSTSGAGLPFINQASGNSTLTNVNNLIQGSGQIGNNGLTFVNQAAGVVNANAASPLLLNASSVTNAGVLEATGGGILQLNTGVANAGANILANGSGSTVQLLIGTTIHGGTLTNNGGTLGVATGHSVTLDGSTSTVTIVGAYTAANNTSTALAGTITNSGAIQVNAGANNTNLSINGAVSLAGGGTVTLSTSGAGLPYINQAVGNSTLTNVNNTIQGSGQLGNNGLAIINQSAINANVPGAVLLVNPSALTNQGSMTASNGGTLQLTSVTFNNAAGTITVNGAASAVQFANSAIIQGGTLATVNGGTLGTASGSGITLDGSTHGALTITGTYTGVNNSTTTLLGTINNTGLIQVSATANNTSIAVDGPVTLTGAGTVTLSTTGAGLPFISQAVGGSTLTNLNNTIQGSGQIGNNGLALVNDGVVNANSASPLLVNATPATNSGVMEATVGATLQLNTTVNNSAATISANGSGSTVQFLAGATIQGGTLNTANSGVLGPQSGNSVTLDGTAHGVLTIIGIYTAANNSTTVLTGTINNTGTIQVSAPSNNTALSVSGAATLTGSGVVSLVSGTGLAFINQATANSTLTNLNNTIQGTGQVGNNGLSVVNQGGSFTTTLTSVNAYQQTAGTIRVASGTTDNFGTFAISGGTAQVDGTLNAPSGINQSGGTVFGAGILGGPVIENGVLQPGDTPSPGVLTINSPGNYTQGAAGILSMTLGGTSAGTQYSQLVATGPITLGGSLDVSLVNGFIPVVGNSFTILTGSSVSGTFSTVNLPALGGANWQVTYNASSVVLSVIALSNPAPALSTIAPTDAKAGSGPFTLTVNGTGFIASSLVNFGGAARTTTFVSSTQLTASILASDIANAGTAIVTVTNPAPGGGTSNPVTFTISAATGAAILYSTGFENPPFLAGSLSGQDGWQIFGPGAVLVENTRVKTGSQAVSVDGSAARQSGPYRSDTVSGPLVELSADIYIASGTTQSAWQFAAQGPNLTQFLGGIDISATGQIQAITAGLPAISTWTYDAWNNIDLLFDISTQTYAITVNGVAIASGVHFCGDNGPCAGANVPTYGTSIFDTFGGGSDTGYIDNFSLTSPVSTTTDLAVTMASSPPAVAVLGNVNYQITVTNNGPNPATGVVLTDVLPANTLFARIDDLTDCSAAGGTLTCNFGTMGVGSAAAKTVNLILVPLAVPAAPGTFDNTVTVAGSQPDPVSSNNSATQTVTVTGSTPSGGGALRNLPGFNSGILGPNDDNSTGAVPIGFNLSFFGAPPVATLFVNNNGNVTLDTSLATFTPFLLSTTTTKIVAPFFADVDTSGIGSGLVTYGNDTVNGRPAFGVNWPNVEYCCSGDPSKLNVFQMILIDRSDLAAGDFDIEFNYDKIQWETGDASSGTSGLGGGINSAHVGYSNGSQTAGEFFELPGSGVPGSFLDTNANTGLIFGSLNSTQPGRYVFPVRGGSVQSSADLQISASGPATASGGDTITYSIVVTNLGPQTATGVTVSNTLPPGFTVVSTTPSNLCPAPAAGQPVVCNLGSMANGAVVNISLQAAIPPTYVGPASEQSVVSVPNNQDLNLANNSASVTTTVTAADLAVTVALVPPNCASGVNCVSYMLTVTNNGPSQAIQVDLNDAISGAATFAAKPVSPTMNCTLVDSVTADCTMASLNANTSASVSVTVNLTGAGWDSNNVVASSQTHDPNPLNNSARIQRQQAGGNTGIGTDVSVQPVDSATGQSPAVLTFSSVTSAGTTSVASSSSGTPPPSGFRTGTPAVFYNLSTTAGHSGTIGVTLSFNGVSFHHPANVRLFHYENNAWIDRTVSVNATVGYAVGVVTSLSPFALFEPLNKMPVAVPGADRLTMAAGAQGAKVTLDGSASFDPDNDTLTYRWTGPFPEGNGTVTGVNPSVTMPPGVGHVTLVVNDGEADSTPALQAITVTDFSMTEGAAGPTTISAGGAVAFNIGAAPQFGSFSDAVTLGCVGLPQGMQCSFAPASVTAGGASSTLTITTTPRTMASIRPVPDPGAPLYGFWLPLPGIAFLGLGGRKRSQRKWKKALLLILLMTALMLLLVSCGGGGMGAVPTPAPTGTAAGNYTITVQGTANGTLQHSTAVSFTVR